MTDLIEIYEILKDLGLCSSKKDFSRNWMGRSSSYLSYLTSTASNPSIASIGMLVGRLEAIAPTSNDSRWHEERAIIRSAITRAKVILAGVYEIEFVPRAQWVTAV